MVAATQANSQPEKHQPRQLQRQQSISQSTSPSSQEEALKRNTDCVYFLASPLTCKKGTDCDYRHSEYARVNPRDCWFWLNGNCLNPKCGFRHPPLDGLLGAPVTGPPVPSSQNIVTPATPTSYGPKSVKCVFFLQGQCLKGNKCLFLHGPNLSTKATQLQGTKQNSEASRPTKTFGNLEPQANVAKSVPDGSVAKPVPRVGIAAETNKFYVERAVPPSVSFSGNASRSKGPNVPAIAGGLSAGINHPHPPHVSDHRNLQNGKDSEEFLRESSPGFDVLVDDDLRASDDYYHSEDLYDREEECLNPITEYDKSSEYNSVVDVHNHGRFRDSQTYASYDHIPGRQSWDQHMTSSEGLLGGPAQVERRGYRKSGSSNNGVSDLQHPLAKQRRVNGLRSVVSHDISLDHSEESSFRSSFIKDPVRQPLDARSVSNRLRGRIKLPDRSPANGGEDHLSGRNGSLSLERTQFSSGQGRHRDRMNGRTQNDYDQERNFRVRKMRRDMNNAGSSDFTGPRSLAELKAVKHTDNKEQPVLGKRNKFEDNHKSTDFSFDGPKPLSEILKEKRQAASSASSLTFRSSSEKGENIDENQDIKISGSDDNDVTKKTQSRFASIVKEDVSINVTDNVVDRNNFVHNQSSKAPAANENEVEDGMIYDEKLEDQELEGDDQRVGVYDDQVYEEDYTYDGDEHVDQEEYLDEEEGDDFAKKIGVMLT